MIFPELVSPNNIARGYGDHGASRTFSDGVCRVASLRGCSRILHDGWVIRAVTLLLLRERASATKPTSSSCFHRSTVLHKNTANRGRASDSGGIRTARCRGF